MEIVLQKKKSGNTFDSLMITCDSNTSHEFTQYSVHFFCPDCEEQERTVEQWLVLNHWFPGSFFLPQLLNMQDGSYWNIWNEMFEGESERLFISTRDGSGKCPVCTTAWPDGRWDLLHFHSTTVKMMKWKKMNK